MTNPQMSMIKINNCQLSYFISFYFYWTKKIVNLMGVKRSRGSRTLETPCTCWDCWWGCAGGGGWALQSLLWDEFETTPELLPLVIASGGKRRMPPRWGCSEAAGAAPDPEGGLTMVWDSLSSSSSTSRLQSLTRGCSSSSSSFS